MPKSYNRVLSVLDYSDQIRSRKEWEVYEAMRILRDYGAVHSQARILIPGAGMEPTIWMLSTEVSEVIALDLYENAGMWSDAAPSEMLTDPGKFAPSGIAYDAARISVVHGDMLDLSRFESNSFDGICSLSSIEHVGNTKDVQQAASEIGRVLKPGGIAAIATEYRCHGDGTGWDGVLLFDSIEIDRVIVKPSKLHMVDELVDLVDSETIETAYPLMNIVKTGEMPDPEAMLSHYGYLFTSVMLALKKPLDVIYA